MIVFRVGNYSVVMEVGSWARSDDFFFLRLSLRGTIVAPCFLFALLKS